MAQLAREAVDQNYAVVIGLQSTGEVRAFGSVPRLQPRSSYCSTPELVQAGSPVPQSPSISSSIVSVVRFLAQLLCRTLACRCSLLLLGVLHVCKCNIQQCMAPTWVIAKVTRAWHAGNPNYLMHVMPCKTAQGVFLARAGLVLKAGVHDMLSAPKSMP